MTRLSKDLPGLRGKKTLCEGATQMSSFYREGKCTVYFRSKSDARHNTLFRFIHLQQFLELVHNVFDGETVFFDDFIAWSRCTECVDAHDGAIFSCILSPA